MYIVTLYLCCPCQNELFRGVVFVPLMGMVFSTKVFVNSEFKVESQPLLRLLRSSFQWGLMIPPLPTLQSCVRL